MGLKMMIKGGEGRCDLLGRLLGLGGKELGGLEGGRWVGRWGWRMWKEVDLVLVELYERK